MEQFPSYSSNVSASSQQEGATLIRRPVAAPQPSPPFNQEMVSIGEAVALPVEKAPLTAETPQVPAADGATWTRFSNALFALPPAELDPDGLVRSWPAVLKLLAADAAPIAGNLLIFFVTQAITLAFVGRRLGTDLQAGFAVALSVFNVCGMSLCIGFLSGLDTLCSQSIGRDPSGRDLPALVHRGVGLALVLTLPIVVFFFTAEPLLVWGFGTTLGNDAATFMRCLPAYIVSNTLQYGVQRSFQAHQATHLSLYAGVAMLATCPVANALFTTSALGLQGTAVALTLTNFAGTALTIALAARHPSSKVRTLPWEMTQRSMREYLRVVFSVSGVREMFAMSLPALASVCAEWWAFELLLLAVSRYGALLADTYSVTFSILVILIAGPAGIASAMGARLGNALGANQAEVAEAWTRIGFICNCAYGLFNAFLLVTCGTAVASIYSTDARVVELFRHGLPAIIAMHFFDALSTTCQNVFRGAGRQALAAKLSLGCLWGIGLPLAIGLTHYASDDSRFPYSLFGFACGLLATDALCAWDIRTAWDWKLLAELAHEAQPHGQESSHAGDP